MANNPSIIAVSKAMAHYHNVTPRNVTVLSLGDNCCNCNISDLPLLL